MISWQHTVWNVTYMHLDRINIRVSYLERVSRKDLEAYLSSERYHMVLTQRKDLDVFDNDKLIMVFVKNSSIDQITDVLLISFGKV